MKQDMTKMFGIIIFSVCSGALALISGRWLLSNPPIDRLLDLVVCCIIISTFLIGVVCVCVVLHRAIGWAFHKLVGW